MKFILSALVENRAGVLSRVAGLFSRRGYNIDSLSVNETEDQTVSRITIVVSEDHETLEQIKKQLNKLVDVIKITEYTGKSAVTRELALIKVNSSPQSRFEIASIADVFRAKIIDIAGSSMTAEITGDEEKIDAFVELLRPYKIKEIVRTGVCAIERGDLEMKHKPTNII